MSGRINRAIERLYGHRLAILVAVHTALIVIANQAAFWLRFDGAVPPEQQPLDTELLPLLIAVRFAVFLPMRLHQGVWRYAGLWDLRNIVIGVIASTAVFWVITHLLFGITLYPRSVFLIDSVLLILLMGGVRMGRRLYSASNRSRNHRRVLIYGAGDAGESIVREMLQNHGSAAYPVGLIDDDRGKTGLRIHGVPVLGTCADVGRIVQSTRAQELLIAIPSASARTMLPIIRALDPHKIRITTLPRRQELRGRVQVSQIRKLELSDLLARPTVGLDDKPIRAFLEGRRVIVTGAGGTIGSELSRQILEARPACLVLLDRHENSVFQIHAALRQSAGGVTLLPTVADIGDQQRIDQTFAAVRPHVVFHAAAHKHVPLMEENPCEAVKNNVRGTRIVAEAAINSNAERFVLISTDKAVHPISVMGATKRVAELLVQALNEAQKTRFSAVRFGNVLGSSGSVIPTFISQIERGGPVTVTHPEMRRFFMLIPEAVQLVLHAAAMGAHEPLLVLDMGEPVRVLDVALDLIRLSGLVPERDIAIQYSGMRPGEKLVERLVASDEVAEPSGVDKVLCVKWQHRVGRQELSESIYRLERWAMAGAGDELRRELVEAVAMCDVHTPARAS